MYTQNDAVLSGGGDSAGLWCGCVVAQFPQIYVAVRRTILLARSWDIKGLI